MFSELIFTIKQVSLIFPKVATDKVAGKLSSTLSWVKNSVSLTVSQMASQVATPSSLHTTVASSTASLSSPLLSLPDPAQPGWCGAVGQTRGAEQVRVLHPMSSGEFVSSLHL